MLELNEEQLYNINNFQIYFYDFEINATSFLMSGQIIFFFIYNFLKYFINQIQKIKNSILSNKTRKFIVES